ncbi:MAG TPA: hypothetical protein VEI54_10780 [Candidatus Limnocylindrales bacterium]|nr:hypothetical protein [Candidatus Limnocylindrales bacterium]
MGRCMAGEWNGLLQQWDVRGARSGQAEVDEQERDHPSGKPHGLWARERRANARGHDEMFASLLPR